jgi:hypothetical protein
MLYRKNTAGNAALNKRKEKEWRMRVFSGQAITHE